MSLNLIETSAGVASRVEQAGATTNKGVAWVSVLCPPPPLSTHICYVLLHPPFPLIVAPLVATGPALPFNLSHNLFLGLLVCS